MTPALKFLLLVTILSLCCFHYGLAQLAELGPDTTYRQSQLPPMPYLPPNIGAAAENSPAILPPKENCNHGKKADNPYPSSTNDDPVAVKKPEVRVLGFTGRNDPHPSEFQQKIDGTTERAILAYLETKDGTETNVRVINLCKDAFHSFYCQDIKPRKRITGAYPAHLRPAAANINEKIRPAGSFENPTRVLPESNKPAPFQIISTTKSTRATTPKTTLSPFFNSLSPIITTTRRPFDIISTSRPFSTFTEKSNFNTFKPFISTNKPNTKSPYAFPFTTRSSSLSTEKTLVLSASRDSPQEHPCNHNNPSLEPANTFNDPVKVTPIEERNKDPCKDDFYSDSCQSIKQKKIDIQQQFSSGVNIKDSSPITNPSQYSPSRTISSYQKPTTPKYIRSSSTTPPPHKCDKKEHQPQSTFDDPVQIAPVPYRKPITTTTTTPKYIRPSSTTPPPHKCDKKEHQPQPTFDDPVRIAPEPYRKPITTTTTTTTPKYIRPSYTTPPPHQCDKKEHQPQPTFDDPVRIAPEPYRKPITTTPKYIRPSYTTPPPHQCDKKEHQPQSTFDDPVRIAPAPATQSEIKKPPNDIRDPCKDPFHSFLCQPTKPRKTLGGGLRRPQTGIETANSKDSPSIVQLQKQTTTTTQKSPALSAEGTFEDPVAVGGYDYSKPTKQLEYPKPTNQLDIPVRPPGYQYPVPKNPLQLPTNRVSEGPAPEVIKIRRQSN